MVSFRTERVMLGKDHGGLYRCNVSPKQNITSLGLVQAERGLTWPTLT